MSQHPQRWHTGLARRGRAAIGDPSGTGTPVLVPQAQQERLGGEMWPRGQTAAGRWPLLSSSSGTGRRHLDTGLPSPALPLLAPPAPAPPCVGTALFPPLPRRAVPRTSPRPRAVLWHSERAQREQGTSRPQLSLRGSLDALQPPSPALPAAARLRGLPSLRALLQAGVGI